MDLDVKLFEQTINEILPNTGVHVRDVNLPKELAEKYVPYTIIKEIGFTDASKRVMGMKTSHRFAILSNHMEELSNGIMVAQSMKRFVKCFFELLTQIIVKVRKCKVQRVCVLHFQLAGSGGCFFLMKLYH